MTVAPHPGAQVGRRLRLEADLRVEVDGRRLHLTGDGRRLRLRVPGVAALARLARSVGGADGASRLAEQLDDAGLTLEVESDRGLVARLGRDARRAAVVHRHRPHGDAPGLRPRMPADAQGIPRRIGRPHPAKLYPRRTCAEAG